MTSVALLFFFMDHNIVIHNSFSNNPQTTSFLQGHTVWVMPTEK